MEPARSFALLAAFGLVLALTAPFGGVAAAAPDPDCDTSPSADGHEPDCNPHLAQSAWSGSHRNHYAQASSPLPGTRGPAEVVDVHHKGFTSVPITLTFSEPYPDGGWVVWASTVGNTGEVVKLDPETMTFIDKYIPQVEEQAPPQAGTISGAYSVLDRDNRLIVGRAEALEVYGDERPGERTSSIRLYQRMPLPVEAQCRPSEDQLVGITMTADGHVAFATELGVVGVVPRDPARMTAEHVRILSLNGDACHDDAVDTDELEKVSNSIAADEDGGIYVVTSGAMYRVDWDGAGLDVGWRAEYETGAGQAAGRLGEGSGATPSLMGTADGEDRFVVITDAQEPMHLVLLWRDELPADWAPIAPDKDPRIACELPVTFGREGEESLSEQSVLVRGHTAWVVNDHMALDPALSQLPPELNPFNQLLSGAPGNAPSGLERFDWDPATRTCSSTWANPDIVLPNGIPTMSAETGLIYAVGAREGMWTLEAIDAETGEVHHTVPSFALPSQNSFYAATTIGPDETVWTGTFGGITRWSQCDPEAGECGRRLGPDDWVVGPLPSDPEELTRDAIGLPNDDPAAGSTPGDGEGGASEDGEAPQGGSDGDAPPQVQSTATLPATGGGLALPLLALSLAGLGARWTRRRPTPPSRAAV
jgi:hypothetical protein